MNPEYNHPEFEENQGTLFARISSLALIRQRLATVEAKFSAPETKSFPFQRVEYISESVATSCLGGIELRTYPFLGSFIGVQQQFLATVSNLFSLPAETFKRSLIEQTTKTAEQWMHRGLELTFKQVEVLSDLGKSQMYNKKRYGVDSPFMFTSVDLEINSDCNRKCVYCPNFAFARTHQGLMGINLFKKITDELGEIDYDHYVHYHFNNEPLLHPDLETLVAHVRETAPRARNRVFTNGDFLTAERFRSLTQAGVDYFIVTLHGSKDGKLYKHIENLLSNISEEDRVKIDIQFPQSLGFNNRSGLVNFGPQVNEETRRLPCFRPSFKMVVLVNGYVLPCDNDFLEQEVMGDTNNDSLRVIWLNGKFTKFRDEISSGNRMFSPLCIDCNKIDHGTVLLYNQAANKAEIGSYSYK